MVDKEILVVLDDAPGFEERVNVTPRLAAQYDARVTGRMAEKKYGSPVSRRHGPRRRTPTSGARS